MSGRPAAAVGRRAIGNRVRGDGDLLDAVVLGPRLARGERVTVRAWGAVGLSDRGMYDDKLICSERPPSALDQSRPASLAATARAGSAGAKARAVRKAPRPAPKRVAL